MSRAPSKFDLAHRARCPNCGAPTEEGGGAISWSGWTLDTLFLTSPVVVKLTPQPAAILGKLISAKGRAVTHDSIRAAIYFGKEEAECEKIVHTVMCKLRKRLPPGSIETIASYGYRLNEAKI